MTEIKLTPKWEDMNKVPDICEHNMYRLACGSCSKKAAEKFSCERDRAEAVQANAKRQKIDDYTARKQRPICTGVLDYFPDALLEIAYVSYIANQQHNPGEKMHWAKEKSIGEGNEILRHMIDRGKKDTDGIRHMAKAAWRALELLQREIEAERNQNCADWGAIINEGKGY